MTARANIVFSTRFAQDVLGLTIATEEIVLSHRLLIVRNSNSFSLQIVNCNWHWQKEATMLK